RGPRRLRGIRYARCIIISSHVKRLLVLLLALAGVPQGLFASVDTVRQNFVDYYAAAGADRGAPRMVDALATLEAQTRAITAPGFLLADGTWSDINYKE